MRGLICAAMLALATRRRGWRRQIHTTAQTFCCRAARASSKTKASSPALPRAQAHGLCAGILYVAGSDFFKNPFGCVNIPYGVTVQQAARVVVPFIEARPQRMH